VIYECHKESGTLCERARVRVQLSRDLAFFLINPDSWDIDTSVQGTSAILSCSYFTGFLLCYCVSVVRRYL